MNGIPTNRGPCVICGATGYPLSIGGPTICPSCDCGNFPQATIVHLQVENGMLKRIVKELEEKLELAHSKANV